MFIVNVEGAICRDDKWLVITRSMKEEHAGGTLSLAGGKVDVEGDTLEILERTVKREFYEEVGIELYYKCGDSSPHHLKPLVSRRRSKNIIIHK